MEDLIREIAKRVPTDAETYEGKDGLLYCRKCNTARQCRVLIFGRVIVVPCICQCAEEAREKEEAERKRQEEMAVIMSNRSAGFPDKELQKYRFDFDDGENQKITNAMKAYVENFPEFRSKGKGLLLYGGTGTGKTFFAACVVNALIDRGYPCLMTNFSRISNKMSGMWEDKQEYIDSLTRFSLVAIDDFGVERDTEYMNENVTTIIDNLYRANVPMIITTNCGPKQFSDEAEIRKKRVYDRILERCHPVMVDGASRRVRAGRSEFFDMNKRLGL